jgi:hypothetical protein
VLSHQTAAELHGLADKVADPIHVTVPWQRRVVAVSGVSIHRSRRSSEAALGYTSPPRTKIEDTVLDLTQTAQSFDDVCAWVTRAFARDLTDEARLRKAVSARAKLRWRTDLHGLIAAAADGDHSVLEFRYDRDVERAHGLPEPRRQVRFTEARGHRGRRDRVYEEYGVVVELDGKIAPPAEDQWRDRTRDLLSRGDGADVGDRVREPAHGGDPPVRELGRMPGEIAIHPDRAQADPRGGQDVMHPAVRHVNPVILPGSGFVGEPVEVGQIRLVAVHLLRRDHHVERHG